MLQVRFKGCTRGLEPPAFGTTIRRSNQLSYAHRKNSDAKIQKNKKVRRQPYICFSYQHDLPIK